MYVCTSREVVKYCYDMSIVLIVWYLTVTVTYCSLYLLLLPYWYFVTLCYLYDCIVKLFAFALLCMLWLWIAIWI